MLRYCLLLGFFMGCLLPASWGWRSELYPEEWTPFGGKKNFYTDAFMQDFSYAGFRSGNGPIPAITGPVWDVTAEPFKADPAGEKDSTLAIQAAIDAAAAAKGGIVFLPAGTYRITPQGNNSYALCINTPNIVLRGAGTDQTFLFNDCVNMRSKSILLIEGPKEADFTDAGSGSSLLTADLDSPATAISVKDGSLFSVGDWVTVRTDITNAWIEEHKVPDWLDHGPKLGGLAYRRQVVAVSGDKVTLDIPIRYAVKTRDNARLVKNTHSGLTEVGLEDFSIGNRQHPEKDTWGHNDFNNKSKTGAYQVHDSYVVRLQRARDCWIRNVASYQPKGNTTTAHILSNGVLLDNCHRVTITRCDFRHPQYGGAGGNGYLFRLDNSSECLVEHCRATFSRHGFSIAYMRSSGNVLHQCTDADTQRALGGSARGHPTGGWGADFHQHFSQSNLIDTCTANNSVFVALWRPFGSVPQHYATATHTVFWNVEGLGSQREKVSYPWDHVVVTEQTGHGYVIGTRGTRNKVKTSFWDIKPARFTYTAPEDWVEGVGKGDTLEPFSLYEDQVRRRLKK